MMNRKIKQIAEAERSYDRVCPLCGTLNRNLYLQETNGLYECEKCGHVIHTTYPGFGRNISSVKFQDIRRPRYDR